MNLLPSVSELMVGIWTPGQQSTRLQNLGDTLSKISPIQPRGEAIPARPLHVTATHPPYAAPESASFNSTRLRPYEDKAGSDSSQPSGDYSGSSSPQNMASQETTSLFGSPTNLQKNSSLSVGAITMLPGINENHEPLVAKSHSLPHLLGYSSSLAAISDPMATQAYTALPSYSLAEGQRIVSIPVPLSSNNAHAADAYQNTGQASLPSLHGPSNQMSSSLYPYPVQPVIWGAAQRESFGSANADGSQHGLTVLKQFNSYQVMPISYNPTPSESQAFPGIVPVSMTLPPVIVNLVHAAGACTDPTSPASQEPTDILGRTSAQRRAIKRRTRTGCLTCRKRRIKCDERKPHCFHCERSRKLCLGYEILPNGHLPK